MKKQVKDAINALVAGWSLEYQKNAKPLVDKIIALIDSGVPVSRAISQALDEVKFFGKNYNALEESLFQAAAQGYGILPAIVTEAARRSIIGKLNTMPWAPDEMNLSTRIHGTNQETRKIINETIMRAMKEGANVVKLSRELYDGYGYGHTINDADLPEYLKRLSKASRKLALTTNDPMADFEFQSLIRGAGRQTGELKTKALKAAYSQLLEKAKGIKEKALYKAAWVATQEKARYNAERIARTEIAKAWADGFLADKEADEDVIAFKWKLSTAHKEYDICDFHAKANLYGLGPGVYPKKKLPPQPAHPHCTCHLEEVFDGELDGLIQRKSIDHGGQKFIEGLPFDKRVALLGVEGSRAWQRGDATWQEVLKSWQGNGKPVARLKREDFKVKPLDKNSAHKINEKDLLPGFSTGKYTKHEYVDKFLEHFNARMGKPNSFVDLVGNELKISERIFVQKKEEYRTGKKTVLKVTKFDREKYLNLLADTIKKPDEIWHDKVFKMGREVEQLKYIRLYDDGSKIIAGYAVFEKLNDEWVGVTTFPNFDIEDLNKKRTGKLRFRK